MSWSGSSDLFLHRRCRVTFGRVLAADATTPIPGATVTLHDAGSLPRTTQTRWSIGAGELELALLDLFFNLPGEPVRFSPAEQLRTATLYSAQAMGLADHFGTLEPGMQCDFIALDEDPFQADPRALEEQPEVEQSRERTPCSRRGKFPETGRARRPR